LLGDPQNMSSEKLKPVYMCYPNIFSLHVLNYLLYKDKLPASGIMLSTLDVKHKGRPLSSQEACAFFLRKCGLSYFWYMLAVARLIPGLTRLCRSNKNPGLKSFKEIARDKGIPLYAGNDFNSGKAKDFLRRSGANLIVSVCNNQVLKPEVIGLPLYRAINIHDAYLPDFRGIEPSFEVLYEGRGETGATVHFVDNGVDTGRIIRQEKVRVLENDTLLSLSLRVWMQGAKMLKGVFGMIEEDRVAATAQSENVRYPGRSYPERERVAEFVKRGGRLMRFRDYLSLLRLSLT